MHINLYRLQRTTDILKCPFLRLKITRKENLEFNKIWKNNLWHKLANIPLNNIIKYDYKQKAWSNFYLYNAMQWFNPLWSWVIIIQIKYILLIFFNVILIEIILIFLFVSKSKNAFLCSKNHFKDNIIFLNVYFKSNIHK